MSATTDVAIKTTCVADAILAMVAVLAMEDAGRAAGTAWTVASAMGTPRFSTISNAYVHYTRSLRHTQRAHNGIMVRSLYGCSLLYMT